MWSSSSSLVVRFREKVFSFGFFNVSPNLETIESFIFRELGIFLEWGFRFIISLIPCHVLNEFCLFSSKRFLKCNSLLFLERFVMWF